MPVSPGAHLLTLTRRSNHAACPVTGSELVRRRASDALRGSSSEIRWLSRKPAVASDASGERPHVPACLPTAFQVHTVCASTPSMVFKRQRIRPWCDSTQIQSPSSSSSSWAVPRFMYKLFSERICRSHAFCESQEWYIIIGRCVIACSGYSSEIVRPPAPRCACAPSSGAYQKGKGSKYFANRSQSTSEVGCGPS